MRALSHVLRMTHVHDDLWENGKSPGVIKSTESTGSTNGTDSTDCILLPVNLMDVFLYL